MTELQREILQQMADGMSQKEIAFERGRSIKTIQEHLMRMRGKLRARTTVEVVANALRQRIIS